MGRKAQDAARLIAAGRTVVGVALLVRPRLAAGWVGKPVEASGAQVAIRALGARDAALGLGTLASANDAAGLRRWLVAASLCDAADFTATLAGPRSPARLLVLVTAAGATIVGLGAAAAIEND